MTPEETKKKNKSEFLQELVRAYARWTDAGEQDYAEAYEVLLHSFTLKKETE